MSPKPCRKQLALATILCLATFPVALASADAAPLMGTPPEISANPNPRVPLAAVVRFDSVPGAITTIAVSDGERSRELEFASDPSAGLPYWGCGRGLPTRWSCRCATPTADRRRRNSH